MCGKIQVLSFPYFERKLGHNWKLKAKKPNFFPENATFNS